MLGKRGALKEGDTHPGMRAAWIALHACAHNPPPIPGCCAQLLEEHAAKQREHDKVVADSAVMLGDLQSWQEKAEALLAELERERAAHAATQAEHATTLAGQTSLQEQQAADRAAAEADRAAAQQREEALLAETAQVCSTCTRQYWCAWGNASGGSARRPLACSKCVAGSIVA